MGSLNQQLHVHIIYKYQAASCSNFSQLHTPIILKSPIICSRAPILKLSAKCLSPISYQQNVYAASHLQHYLRSSAFFIPTQQQLSMQAHLHDSITQLHAPKIYLLAKLSSNCQYNFTLMTHLSSSVLQFLSNPYQLPMRLRAHDIISAVLRSKFWYQDQG